MNTKTVFQTGDNGVFIGATEADESPLEPGVFLIPGGCVEVAPPAANDNEIQRWTGGGWVVEPRPVEPEQPNEDPEPMTIEYVQAIRRNAYRSESDPLFMEWQYDQTAEAEQAWCDKVIEIKARYPLPDQ